MAFPERRSLYFTPQEADKVVRRFEVIVFFIALSSMAAAFHVHQMLTVGDWDFWTDWKDRRWWVTLTPILLVTFPAAIQATLWEKFRFPVGATFTIAALHFGEWMDRVVNFYGWAWYPVNFVFPSLMFPSAIILDITLMLTRSYMFTALFGGMAWGLMFYPSNWTLIAPFHLPVQHVTGSLMSVADVQGYEYVRSATPEYIRIIERGTLRTFGRDVTPVSSFFTGFVSGLMYLIWHWFGKWMAKPTFIYRT